MKSPVTERFSNNLVNSEGDATSRSPANKAEPNRTLLVVDDDPIVRGVLVQVLRLQGYTVLQAESALEALRLATSTATIHLLITDLLMPDVDGLELTHRFRAAHPMIPVLMVSGSIFMLPDGFQVNLDRFGLPEKPFELSELFHKVHSLLNTGPNERRPL